MNGRGLLIGTSALAALAIAWAAVSFSSLSTPNAEFAVGIGVAFVLCGWGALFGLYLRDSKNAAVVSGMGPPPAISTKPSPPNETSPRGTGSVSSSLTVIAMPSDADARDELRVERFLRDASFPNEWSRRNAATWLKVFRIQHPYLSAELPPATDQALSRIRAEVAAESISRLREEVRAYFGRNEMSWPEVPAPPEPAPASPSVGGHTGGSDAGIGPRGPPESAGPQPRLPANAPPDKGRPPARPASARGKLAEEVLFDDTLAVAATGHREVHFDLRKGTRLRGIAREESGQPFDLYIMDRKNYVRFARDRDSFDILAELDESLYDYRLTIPRDDTWFVVVDTYGKVNDRNVWLEVRAALPS